MPPFLFGGCVLVGQIYFVYVKVRRALRLPDGWSIPFNVKSVFLVEVGKVFVVRVLRYIVLIAEKGRTPRNCKIHFPPSITAISSRSSTPFPISIIEAMKPACRDFRKMLKLSIVSRPKFSEISFAFFPRPPKNKVLVGIVK